MASFTEILTLLAIIVGILILPKMFRKEEKIPKKKLSVDSLSVSIRFGIIASILIPIVSALYFQPWKKDLILFVLFGIIPLIIGWGLYWMFAGLKSKDKKA